MAPTPPVHLAANDKAVTLLSVTTGTVGAGGIVVTVFPTEYVVPVGFTAATIRAYVLLGDRPVNVAERLVRPASIEGVTNCELTAYMYEMTPIAPVQVAVNETSVVLVMVTTGIVGAGGIVCTFMICEFVLPVPFLEITTTS